MVDPAVITMVKDIVTILGVIGGFTYYVMTVRATQRNQKHQLETRQAQFLLDLNNMWTKEKAKDWQEISVLQFQDTQDFFEKYDYSVNPEIRLQWSTTFDMMNNYGKILKPGLIDSETMYNAMDGVSTIKMWNKYEPIVQELRKRRNAPFLYEFFEYLAEEMEKVHEIKLQSVS